MSLSKGTGPFGENRAGQGNYEIKSPKHIVYFDPSPKRVRVFFNDEVVADSRETRLLHETGLLPVYYFPLKDIRSEFFEKTDHSTHCPFKGDASYWSIKVGDKRVENVLWAYEQPIESAPFLKGYGAFYFERMDAWFEEDEQIFVHPKDPYSRIDILASSSHVRVSLEGQVFSETDRPTLLFETSLPTRHYIPKEDVRMDLLEVSGHETQCAYKGQPVHFSAPRLGEPGENIAWCYEDPNPEVARIAGLVCFYNERVDLEVDGAKVDRPRTQWSSGGA